jgi:hypothetical protein
VNPRLVFSRGLSRERVWALKSGATASTIAGCLALATSSALAAPETVALWVFDEPAGFAPGGTLPDAGSGAYPLTLGAGATLVPGKFSRALQVLAPGAREIPTEPNFATRLAPRINPISTRLNLGAHDWTLECWLWLAANADAEGVIFEIGAGDAAETELLTRFAVLPSENAFVVTGITHHPAGRALPRKRIEYSNPEGPPTGVAYGETLTLPLPSALRRGEWFHVALVHPENGALRLYVDGMLAAVAAPQVDALPSAPRGYISIGCDGRSNRVLNGAIDELRISAAAIYAADFMPPASFSHTVRTQAGAKPGDFPPR